MARLEFDHVTKRYGDGFQAVSDLTLEVADGELLILVGPSGCGKSTALRMVAGLEDVTAGSISIAGERVTDRAPKARDVAMVFQNYALYPHMTVRDNMGFALRLRGSSKADIAAKVEAVADVLSLADHLDRRPGQLSGGQRQRVAMGRAIVREPKAFLMDEPLSNLDAKLRVEMRAVIGTLQRELGTTMVYVTHDQTEAMTLGDRVAVMRAGVLQQVGSPRHLYDEPVNLFVAGFMGSPAMNFVAGTFDGQTVTTALGTFAGDALRPSGSEVVVGVRPEHLSLSDERPRAVRFQADVQLVEDLGSDAIVHFTYPGPEVQAEQLEDVARDRGVQSIGRHGAQRGVARLDEVRVAPGDKVALCFDAAQALVFDAGTGETLGRGA